jgi:hypothetical protein
VLRIALVAIAIGLPQNAGTLGKAATRAQSATASLSGTVVDERGAVVSGVSITITSVETAVHRQVATNKEGYFAASLLTPDRYTVTAEHQGFARVEIRDVVLNVNDQRSLRIELRVGRVSDSVTVEGASLIKTESAAVSTLVDRQFVENLPLNGRSLSTLIELTPGVVLTKGNSSEQGQFSVNGQRSNANHFMVDGVGANVGISPSAFSLSQTAGGTVPAYGPLGGTNSLVSIDALQEFRIQTSIYAPEFGRTPGAQVSIVTRSGGNKLHGTVFDYFRNDALDANDWFANSQRLKKPELRQNDFGGVLGGPIVKNKTFFFFSYEGLRLRQPQVGITTVPTLSARRQAPAAIKPLLDGFPLPTGPDLGEGLAEASASYSNPTTLNTTSLRVDHTLSAKFTLFGRYSYAPSETRDRLASGQLNNLFVSKFNTQTLTMGATQAVNSRVSNDIRVNYTRSSAGSAYALDSFGGAIPPGDSLLFLPFAKRETTVSLVGVGPANYLAGGDNLVNFQRQFNLVDNLLIAARSHQLKFGADYRRLSPNLNASDYVINILFDDVAGAIAAAPSFVGTAARSSRYLLFTNFSAYAQDTWKAANRLTLTYGLRWEVNPVPSETRGNDAFTVTGLNDPATITLAPQGTPLWRTTYNNFAPRVGVAYQMSRANGGESVLRGGFGVFYDLGTGAAGNAFGAASWPYMRIKTLPNTFPIDPAQAEPPPINLNPPYGDLRVYPDFKLPRTYQWNVSVERALGAQQTITASYVAAVGRRLLRQEVLRPNPSFTRLVIIRNAATSDYHALQLQFQRRLSRGLQALASYTWSHSIDIASGETFRNVSVTKLDPGIDRGPSNFDVRHALSGAVTYDIPEAIEAGIAGAVLRNWSVDAIFRARTATPVDLIANTPPLFGVNSVTRPDLIAGVPLYVNDPAVAGGRLINKSAFRTPPNGRQGTLGRNSLRGFPLSQLDFALRRRFSLGERLKMQWRVDFFNLLNHPNFGDPVTFLGSPLFGQSLQMLGRDLGGGDGGFSPLYQIGGPRSIQLALKLQF